MLQAASLAVKGRYDHDFCISLLYQIRTLLKGEHKNDVVWARGSFSTIVIQWKKEPSASKLFLTINVTGVF